MKIWTQILLMLVVAVGALTVWAVYLPSARPFLEDTGALAALERIGLVNAAQAPEEAGAGQGAGRGGGAGPATVIAQPVSERVMRDRTVAIGTAQSVRSVVLATEISGQIKTLDLDSGTYVERGALIAELDDQAARITLDRAALMMADEQRNYDRRVQLRSSGSVTDLQLQEADLARKSAELSLREAEFELRRHRITAPISGWVGLLTVGAGDLVSAGAMIATIEDRSSLLVEFRVPERLASRIEVGDPIQAAALVDPGAALQGTISAIDNRVDAASRSLRVQATLPNDSDRLRPGMAISLSIDLTGDSYSSIDPLAIQWGASGAYVWVLRDGKAAQMPIRIVQRNADDALVEAEFAPGDLVVTEGVMALRPGAPAVAAEPAGSAAGEPTASGG